MSKYRSRFTVVVAVTLLAGLTVTAQTSLRGGESPKDLENQSIKTGPRLETKRLPLLFEPTPVFSGKPDLAERTRFVARGAGYDLVLSESQARFAAGAVSLRLTFPGAKLKAPPEPLEEQASRVSYFVGRDPAKWREKAALFRRIRYRDLYPGIDVEFYGVREQTEFDFVLRPGADPTVVSLQLEGAGRIEKAGSGGLTVHVEGMVIQLRLPRVYQPGVPDSRIEAEFELLAENRIGFRIGDHDPALPLVIDPTLSFSTFLGEANSDNAQDVTLDAEGNVYLAGVTHGRNFGQDQDSISAPDLHAFVAKLNPEGTELEYAVVLGGGLPEEASAITVDAEGNAYIVGSTFSPDFPVTADALQPVFAGGNTDVFVVKLSPTGELLYSTFLGGSRQDMGKGIGVSADGQVIVAGTAISDDFPLLPGALRTFKTGDFHDGFISKLDIENRVLTASTFLGGSGRDEILDLAVDAFGNVVVTGVTTSVDFPTSPQTPQPDFAGVTDAFVTKFNPEVSEILFSTFLGGSLEDRGQTLAVDVAGDVYLAGRTLSRDFPATPGALQENFANGSAFGDAFAARLAADGSELIYATYLGGSSEEEAHGIAVGANGQANIAGATGSPDFPLTADARQSVIHGLDDIFVTRLSADGSRAVYSTLFGGGSSDRALGIASDGRAGVVVVGVTDSGRFPVTAGVWQPQIASPFASDALIVRFDGLVTPKFSEAGIVNTASTLSGPIAPGELISIFGEDLGPSVPGVFELTPEGLFSTSVAETRVLFDGIAAPLIYVSETQINAVVPYAVAGRGSVDVEVEYLGVVSGAISVEVTDTSPGILTQNNQWSGPAAALNRDFSVNSVSNPTARGSVVMLFATGEGETDRPVDGLRAAAPFPRPLLPVTAMVGGRPAEVLYAGGAPGLVAGVLQVNVRIPAEVTPGEILVVLRVGSAQSQPFVTVAVR